MNLNQEDGMKVSTGQRVFWTFVSLIIAGIIFLLSSQSTGKSGELSDQVAGILKIEQVSEAASASNQKVFFGLSLRNIAHIILFSALGFSLFFTFRGIRFGILLAIGSGYLYAVADELHQSLVGRHSRWQDTLIDLAGILLGICFALLVRKLLLVCRKRKGGVCSSGET